MYSPFKNIKRNLAVRWMDLEDMTLNEISQTEKDKYKMLSLVCGI